MNNFQFLDSYFENSWKHVVSSITDPKSFDDGYAIFKFAQALVDHPAAVKLATSNVLKEFAEDNVVYIELRSTPRDCAAKMTKKEYIESIVQSIKGQRDIKATLLVSIGGLYVL